MCIYSYVFIVIFSCWFIKFKCTLTTLHCTLWPMFNGLNIICPFALSIPHLFFVDIDDFPFLICPSFPPLPPGVPPQPTKHPNTFIFLWLCKALCNFTSPRVEYVPIMRIIPTFLNWLKDWLIKRTVFFPCFFFSAFNYND